MGGKYGLTYHELSVINRACSIISSSLDIPRVFDRFVAELKKILDVNWAAVTHIGKDELELVAVFSENGSIFKRPHFPLPGTASEWVINNKLPLFQEDLAIERKFVYAEPYYRKWMRSAAHFPLIVDNNIPTGSFIIASLQPNECGLKYSSFLNSLVSQIVMPIEHSRLYAEVQKQARIDELTGLFNRRSLEEVIPKEICRHVRYGGTFSFIILGLDSFKAFNEQLGYLAGDALLRKIGRVLNNSIRSADQAFRYGDDEFAIFLPNTPAAAGKLVCERIRRQIQEQQVAGEKAVTTSLGLATWPADGSTPEEIIKAADAALYRAKTSGG